MYEIIIYRNFADLFSLSLFLSQETQNNIEVLRVEGLIQRLRNYLLGDGFPERRIKSILRRVDRKKLDWDFNATKKVHFEVRIKIPNSKAPFLSSTFLVWYGLLIYFLQ